MENKKAFTLMEIMIVITLLVILATTLLVTLNPMAQINKGQDSKRKQELTQLSKVLEDYYNDKQCYPLPSKICYDAGSGVTCHICGNQATSPSFSPYLSTLPCDPLQPNKKYIYQVDNITCPTWFRIYTVLSNKSDPIITSVGCQAGCGPSPDFSYNFGVSSPNVGLENVPSCTTANDFYCLCSSSANCSCGRYPCCKHCGSLSSCQSGGCGNESNYLYTDNSCSQSCHL